MDLGSRGGRGERVAFLVAYAGCYVFQSSVLYSCSLLQRKAQLIPSWELDTSFDPLKALAERRLYPAWVNYKGNPAHSLPHDSTRSEILSRDWDSYGQDWESLLTSLPLRDPSKFVAGQVHSELGNWERVLQEVDNEHTPIVRKWLNDGVDVFDFFRPFKGKFNGVQYDDVIPPPTIFNNYQNCEPFKEDIARQLEEGIRSGSLEILGRVGEVEPPHLVMPLLMVVQPRKNRLCHDERFLNLFMKAMPFSLEGLKLIPSLLEEGDYMASSDEKSAYMGVKLSEQSRTFFGVEFAGWYLRYRVLPFGWSISPYAYQTIGMQVTSFLRLRGVTTFQYIDDRFLGPVSTSPAPKLSKTGLAIFFNAATLSALGFTIEFLKSLWYPALTMKHLGLMVHSDSRHFEITEDKKLSFIELREQILNSNSVDVKMLQKFMGKCVSLYPCVAAAKLYIRVMAKEIGLANKSHNRMIYIRGQLREEVQFWKFLDKFRSLDEMEGRASYRFKAVN